MVQRVWCVWLFMFCFCCCCFCCLCCCILHMFVSVSVVVVLVIIIVVLVLVITNPKVIVKFWQRYSEMLIGAMCMIDIVRIFPRLWGVVICNNKMLGTQCKTRGILNIWEARLYVFRLPSLSTCFNHCMSCEGGLSG